MKPSPSEHITFASVPDPRDPLHTLRVRVDFHPTLTGYCRWEITILGIFRLDTGGEVDFRVLPVTVKEELLEACENAMKTNK